MAEAVQVENPLALTGEKSMMWLPYVPPAAWVVEELRRDPHIKSIELFSDRSDAAEITAKINPDISGLPDSDRPVVYELGNNLRKFIFQPVIIDTFGPQEHITGRRPWLAHLKTVLNKRRGHTEAARVFDFIQSNKLSNGEIGKTVTSLEFLSDILPGLVPAHITTAVRTMHKNNFSVYRTDALGESYTKYDDMPLEEKRSAVASLESVIITALQSLNGAGRPPR